MTPKTCASETCSLPVTGRRPQAIYCSKRCAKCEARRQYRKRQKVSRGSVSGTREPGTA